MFFEKSAKLDLHYRIFIILQRLFNYNKLLFVNIGNAMV